MQSKHLLETELNEEPGGTKSGEKNLEQKRAIPRAAAPADRWAALL